MAEKQTESLFWAPTRKGDPQESKWSVFLLLLWYWVPFWGQLAADKMLLLPPKLLLSAMLEATVIDLPPQPVLILANTTGSRSRLSMAISSQGRYNEAILANWP